MTRTLNDIPIAKVSATLAGAALTGAAIFLNAEHVAQSDGWASPLVAAGVIVTVAAAITPPCAERAGRSGEWLKASALWLFFLLACAFSLTATIGRHGGHSDTAVASVEDQNLKARIAQEGYESARQAVQAECATGRGKRCRAAEQRLDKARADLGAAAPVKPANSGAERIAAVIGTSPQAVQLYAPLALPFAVELGGFVLLWFGMSPRRTPRPAPEPLPAAVTLQAETVPAVQQAVIAPQPKPKAEPLRLGWSFGMTPQQRGGLKRRVRHQDNVRGGTDPLHA